MADSSRPSDEDGPVFPSDVDDAALVRKIDMRVMPMLFAIYFVAFLDRYVNEHVIFFVPLSIYY